MVQSLEIQQAKYHSSENPIKIHLQRQVLKFIFNMSDKCGSCDCADKSQCVKKGNSYDLVIVETENRSMDTVVVDAPAAENDGKCKCGTSCSCVNCTCGH